MTSVEIEREGGQLYAVLAESNDRLSLIPMDYQNLEILDYFVITETGGKMVFQFEITNQSTWLHFERNKWKKQ